MSRLAGAVLFSAVLFIGLVGFSEWSVHKDRAEACAWARDSFEQASCFKAYYDGGRLLVEKLRTAS